MAFNRDDSTPSQSPQPYPIRPAILRRTFTPPIHPSPGAPKFGGFKRLLPRSRYGAAVALHRSSAGSWASTILGDPIPGPVALWIRIKPFDSTSPVLSNTGQQSDGQPGIVPGLSVHDGSSTPAGQLGVYPPGNSGYPPNYGQTQSYGDTPMPDYQFPSRQG
ncbi:hypothetical protein DFH08DRAFT_821072 [Mycena albidolilacea]|uniref:Uncharacterized protein n=1 Tax=Mycena albidolilacea TaxID=1033008 RepID=A0AAD6ZAR3_9AGAR|nr:hypothetical protein DFH08DRAFT_821072 [Mycena albidolilacea]